MTDVTGRGGRGRMSSPGRAPANRGGRGSLRGGCGGGGSAPSGPRSPKSLIVRLQVHAPQHAGRLPTPERTTLSSPDTPPFQRDSLAPVVGNGKAEGEGPLMAPVRDPNNVDDQIKDVIQHLFEVQSAVHGYLPETQEPLVDKIIDLTHSLSALRTLAASSNSSVAGVELPPEILDYVDGGRNPDVYTREFVELVQRGNAVLHGKQEAFKSFAEIFAQELATAMPETARQVHRVVQNAGLEVRASEMHGQQQQQGERKEEEEKDVEGEERGPQGNGGDG